MLRTIRHRTTGQRRGPITRLVSPGDLGETPMTYQLDGDVEVEDTSGQKRWYVEVASNGCRLAAASGIAVR